MHFSSDIFWSFKLPKVISVNKSGFAKPDSGYQIEHGKYYNHDPEGDTSKVSLLYVKQKATTKFIAKMPDKKTDVFGRSRLYTVTKDSKCQLLIENTEDIDGQNKKGDKEPIGELFGILSLKQNLKSENWIVMNGIGYETSDLTFVKVPIDPKNKIKKYFLFA